MSTAKNLSDVEGATQITFAEGKSIVYGQVIWIENGEQKKIGSGIFDFFIKPSLLRLEDKARILCDVGEYGDFSWALEPGTYVINKIQYRDTWSGNYFFVPQIGFRISEAQKVYYIGSLKADCETERDLIGGLFIKAKFTIEDHSEQATSDYSQKKSFSREEIETALMVQDNRLPRTFDTTAEYNIGLQILNAILQAM